ncbi:hypothetical protein MBH78_19330 [Oceanimonas sp. NS1]|nr:hypothetical protein [Oceanimonas sp. NS1]
MLIIALVFTVLVLALVIKGLMIVQQSEAVVIERLGSYQKTLSPGINWIIPLSTSPVPSRCAATSPLTARTWRW